MTQQSRHYGIVTALAVLLSLPAVVLAGPSDPQKHKIFAVENALYGAGYTIYSADGVADNSTREALRVFQEKQSGLKPTGEMDEATLQALGIGREYKRADKKVLAVKAPEPAKAAAPTVEEAAEERKPIERDKDRDWLFSW